MKLSQIWQIKVLRRINKQNIDEDTLYFVLTLIVGVCSGLIAVLIRESIHFLTHHLGTYHAFTFETLWKAGLLVLVSAIITSKFYPSTSGSGIPNVKIALVVNNGKISFGDWVAKMIASVTSLASGFSLGREGPTVAVCSGLASSLGHMLSLSKNKIKALVSIGAAGGIAAAFNTPIAAVIFALEEVVGNLNTKMLGSMVISTVIAAITASFFVGNQPVFTPVAYTWHDSHEMAIYLAIGILASFIGPLWVKTVLKLREINKSVFRDHKFITITLSFLIMAAVSLYFPDILGSGHHVANRALLSEIRDWQLLLILFALKFILTAICYSSGVSGGLFLPTLFMGAMLGGLTGAVADLYFPNHVGTIGAYALVGMGAYFAAVIRAPFTSIIMIFEMTHDYKIVIPLMIANIISYVLSSKFLDGSIYENISEQDGVHLPTKEDYDVLESLVVEDAMIREVITLDSKMTIKEAMNVVNHSEVSGYPVMSGKYIAGVISSHEIGSAYARFQGEATLIDICVKHVITIYPDQSLMVAFHKLNKHKISRLLVVSRINNKRLIGIITPEDIVCHFGFHIQEESKCDVIDHFIDEYEKKSAQLNQSSPSPQSSER